MSRDNYSAELSAAGYFLADWVCNAENSEELARIINAGLDRYTQQRTARVNSLGVPCFDDTPLEVDGMTPPPVTSKAKEAPPSPEAREMEPPSDMLGVLSQHFQGAVTSTVSTAKVVINYGRLFSAQVIDKALSNRVEVVLKAFNNRINESNAQMAFLFIGRQPDGWVPAGGVARVSLNTLVLCLVLEHVVEVKAVQAEKKPSPAGNASKKEEDPNEKERKAHFALFCNYLKNGVVNPRTMSDQAMRIFVGFESYPDGLSLSQKLMDADWEEVSKLPEPEAPRPSA